MILLVDDDAGVRQVVEAVLDKCGYRVEVAEDGEAALRMLDAGLKPSVVLVDLLNPKMDGNELIAELVRRDTRLSIIVMSAYIGEVKEELHRHISGVIPKPAMSDDLIAVLGKFTQKNHVGAAIA